jgi:thymidylate kinase
VPAKIFFLEGPNYCGKSTITKALTNIIDDMGKSFYTTFEPGGDEIGMAIRDTLLNKELNEKCEMDYTCRRLLYAASHAQMLQDLRKKIYQYDYIIIDRYNPISDLVYGPMEKDSDENFKRKLNLSKLIFGTLNNEFLIPYSYLFFLDISIETLKERDLKRNTKEHKLYDYKDFAFKESIWMRYKLLSKDLIENTEKSVYRDFLRMSGVHLIKADGEANEAARKIMELVGGEQHVHKI